MGSITPLKYPRGHEKAGQQRKQGRRLGWQLRYMDPREVGHRVSTTYWGSRADADAEMERLEQGAADGLSFDPDIRNLTVKALRTRALADYIWLTKPSTNHDGVLRARSTFSKFKAMMSIVANSPLDPLLVRTVKPEDIDDAINGYRLKDGSKPSEETLKTLTAALTKLFGYAVKFGVITESGNPMRRRTQTGTKFSYGKPVKWAPNKTEVENVAVILDAKADYLGAMCRVLYWTGMRVEEALAVKQHHIDWERKRIHIEEAVTVSGGRRAEGNTKTPAGARYVPIVGQCEAPLRLLVDRSRLKGCEYVFMGEGRPSRLPSEMTKKRSKRERHAISYSAWRTHLKAAVEQAAIEHGQPVFTSLDLRHAYATNCLNSGFTASEVASLLGHSTDKIVMSRYQSLVDRDLTAEADEMTRRFNAL